MFVLFVGGLQHGTTVHVEDGWKLIELEDPRIKAGRQVYEVHHWAGDEQAHGFDALAVNNFVMPGELDAKIRDALVTAGKATAP